MDSKPNLYLLRAEDIAARSQTFSHPWNAKSEVTGYQMGKATGLRRTGVNLSRVAPGKESFVYHLHWQEEEWIYILEGRALAKVDDLEFEVKSGDFLAFPTGIAHHLRNPFDAEVVYLMGGEHRDFEVADFPELGKRVIRDAKGAQVHDLANAAPFGPLENS
jgi:uncharacterized cupin superfamily protein